MSWEPGICRVYVAGPYSADPGQCTQDALKVATLLLDAGMHPFVPHLTHFWHAAFPRDYETWLANDLAWLNVADVVLRLPGHSPGADREVERARHLGKPVYESARELIAAWEASR